MKKFTLFLSTLLFSMMSFGAPLGEGYSKVTDITTLSAGDKVVLYCDDAELGITGWDGNKTATAATTGWVEYVVEAAEGGVLLKDTDKYIALTAKNAFYYNETGSVCKVNATGVLYITFNGADYLLYENANNGNPLYRMYVDKTGNAQYKPFYVYLVGEGGNTTPDDGGETPDDGGETPEVTADTITCAEAATIAAAENYLGTDTVTVVGYVTELGNAKDDGSKQCFYMADTKDGGKVFMAYWAFVSKLYVVGDKVAVTGILKNYNGTIEIVDGQSALLEAAAGETPDDGGETPDDDGETPANVTFDFTTKEGLEALGIAYPTTDAGNGACATDLEEGKAYSQNGISLTAKYGSTATRIWLAASGKLDLRHYKGGVLTFAAPSGKVITNIVFDGADVSGLTTLVDKAWTGNASTVEIPAAADAKTIKINTITVHVADASSDYVATPAISGETNFLENTTVTITAEEGLEVYYTLDGTDPTKASNKYTAPFELTATTTVKAIAYNGDKASAVVEKKFTKMTILTCAEAVALCTNPATPGQHIIHGYVTEMIEAYNDQYKNITFWMADTPDGGQVLQAFRVKPFSEVEQSLKVGDFVEVIGSLILYTKDGVSTPEVNAGGSVKLITAGDTAVDNLTVDQPACKFIENGQLIIIKNGVQYNAQGQVIK